MRAPVQAPAEELGDFTTTRRVVPMALLAMGIGVVCAFVAQGLLLLIGLFTNLFFFQRWSTSFASPADHTLGWLGVLVPVAGAILVGLMARYGSERIRGHGIPEALEAILIRGSRIEPRVALLKPISSAISIGSGGPFGAEGPIIMTGGAFGSIIAQRFHLTSAERKTLLVAGAAAGMSATFAAPIASVLLAVELLLFELKPRSFVPVALASAAAMLVRQHILGPGPLFPVPVHFAVTSVDAVGGAGLIGFGAGVLAALMTWSVYASEDLFKKLPIPWMWWPALGAVAVGLGGALCPRALGVGYDTIASLLGDRMPIREVLLLVAVKWAIWALYLGSGTSGGVLAPLLMIGSALGGLLGLALPTHGAGFWSLLAMAAILGGTMRSPLTGVVFAVELTGEASMLLPLLVACTVAHGFTVLVLKRSILTEKVARRGFHVTREYAVDSLELLFVREVMDTDASALAGAADTPDAHAVQPEEHLGVALSRMAETSHACLPVIDRSGARVGVVTLAHTLEARRRHLEEEGRREGTLPLNAWLPLGQQWARLFSSR